MSPHGERCLEIGDGVRDVEEPRRLTCLTQAFLLLFRQTGVVLEGHLREVWVVWSVITVGAVRPAMPHGKALEAHIGGLVSRHEPSAISRAVKGSRRLFLGRAAICKGDRVLLSQC